MQRQLDPLLGNAFLFTTREKMCTIKKRLSKMGIVALFLYKWISVQIKDSRGNAFVIVLFTYLSVEFLSAYTLSLGVPVLSEHSEWFRLF